MNDNHQQSLEKGLISTLKDQDIRSLCKDYSELAIDAFLKEGLVRDIPIVNSVFGLAKAGFSVRDRIFVEKVIRFISPLSKYSNEERARFFDSLDEDELKKATESVVLYLERLDSLEKPEMMGKVFEAYMKNEITYKSMMYFIYFIDSVFIMVWRDYYDGIEIVANKKSNYAKIAIDDAKALEVVGIYELVESPKYDVDIENRLKYISSIRKKLVLTDVGRDFIKVVFGFWLNEKNEYWRHQLEVDLSDA